MKEHIYHVVTERPMTLHQKIIFDEDHHNGVYHRVTTFMRIRNGDDAQGELADFIRSDMQRWKKVALRERALEKVRMELFPRYPSRMACLYTSRTLEEAEKWAKFFQELKRNVYSIVKLSVSGRIFDGDACNCFDGTDDEVENREKALRYWYNDVINEKPVIETLVDGEIVVEEIVRAF